MNEIRQPRRQLWRVFCMLLPLLVPTAALGTPVRAATPAVRTFYAATKASYAAWNNTTSTAPPASTDVFPTGTTVVTFYFEYTGTTANSTQFEIVVHNHEGATFASHGPYTLSLGAGLHMSEVPARTGTAYPDGAYKAVLLIDGHAIAGATFRIGAAPLTVVTFYPATKAAEDAWNATSNTSPPPGTTSFPAGTNIVSFYFRYRGARARSTRFSITIRTRSGAAFRTDGPFILTYVYGLEMDAIAAPSHTAYPGGAYHADLLLNGHVAAGTIFTVRRTSSAGVTQLYPATKSAYDAWLNTNSTARPTRTDTFQTGTTIVAFYFEYRGAVARSTQFQFIVRDSAGRTAATYGPLTFSYKAALAMHTVTRPNGAAFHDGTYRVVMVVDGRVAATTSFIVRRRQAGIGAFYAATKAAYAAWTATTSTTPPPRTTVFRSGTAVVAFYFAYNGATPQATTYKYVVYDHANVPVATHGPYAVQYRSGYQMSEVTWPAATAYPNGFYRADLLIDGRVSGTIYFAVGTLPAPPACRSSDVAATCVEPSVLRLHANLSNNSEVEGTGFVIRSDRTGTYVLTNSHVVDGATPRDLQAVSPDGHTYYNVLAMKTADAPEGSAGDLALLKLPPSPLRPLAWGDSNRLKLLQPVVSIGYGDAFQLPGPPTITEGSISALHRDIGDGFGPVWIQHQSFINHGNSGGPLLDMHFNVAGINTLSPKEIQGIFLAIPANSARQIARKLMGQM